MPLQQMNWYAPDAAWQGNWIILPHQPLTPVPLDRQKGYNSLVCAAFNDDRDRIQDTIYIHCRNNPASVKMFANCPFLKRTTLLLCLPDTEHLADFFGRLNACEEFKGVRKLHLQTLCRPQWRKTHAASRL